MITFGYLNKKHFFNLNVRAMKTISFPTRNQVIQLSSCIKSAEEFINAYKQSPDEKLLKERLCQVIDKRPNIAYLDPDVLSCYDIEVNDSSWVECDEEEEQYDREQLKGIVNGLEGFEPHHLSFGSSGSILRTIFGDAYDEVKRL